MSATRDTRYDGTGQLVAGLELESNARRVTADGSLMPSARSSGIFIANRQRAE